MHVQDTEFTGTPFNPCTAPLNLKQLWFAWDRYHVVDVFSDVQSEINAVRETAGMLDMSPLAKHMIAGPAAEQLVDKLIVRDATKLGVGQIYYTPWCNEQGKLVSDGMVLRLTEDSFRISGDPSMHWFKHHAQGLDVDVTDVTHELALLSLQGPQSQAIVTAASGEDWSDFKFSRIRTATIGGARVEVARQGFTGEHGYELWIANADAVAVWSAVYAAGSALGVKPVGAHANDVARVEAGLIIPGPDYTGGAPHDERGAAIEVDDANQNSPFELAIGRFVDFDKSEFIGRDALLAERQQGVRRNLVGLSLDWNAIVARYMDEGVLPDIAAHPRWYPLPVVQDGQDIGRATSVTWSPRLKQLIGFGVVDNQVAVPGQRVTVQWVDARGQLRCDIAATVVDMPFVKIQRSK